MRSLRGRARDGRAAVCADRRGARLGRGLLRSGDDAPCLDVFTADEEAAAEALYRALAGAEEQERMLRAYVGYAEETWVPAAHYEKAKAGQRGDQAGDVGGGCAGRRGDGGGVRCDAGELAPGRCG